MSRTIANWYKLRQEQNGLENDATLVPEWGKALSMVKYTP